MTIVLSKEGDSANRFIPLIGSIIQKQCQYFMKLLLVVLILSKQYYCMGWNWVIVDIRSKKQMNMYIFLIKKEEEKKAHYNITNIF